MCKEGARHHGYTGQRGYHPLLAIAAGTGDVLMARLREGRANTARGAAHFLRETVGRVPPLTLRLITRWRRLRPAGLFSDGTSGSATKSIPRPTPGSETPQGMCLDKGYDYGEVRRTLAEFGFTAHIRSRGEVAKAIKRAAGFKARAGWWNAPTVG